MRKLVCSDFQTTSLLNQSMSKLRLRSFSFPDDDRKQIKSIKPLILVKLVANVFKKIRFEVVVAQIVFSHALIPTFQLAHTVTARSLGSGTFTEAMPAAVAP